MNKQNSLLNDILSPIFNEHHLDSCYPGLIFYQGMRKMLQINVPAHNIVTLLQAKPSENNDPDSGKNRPVIPDHAKEIKNYIIDRVNKNKPWILGTLTANIDPNKIKIFELIRNLCIVVIPGGVKLDITDGQHRQTAITELIQSDKYDIIANNQIPITLVLEENFNQCQIDFRDMAHAHEMSKSLLASFGHNEGKIGITKKLANEINIFVDKTNKIDDKTSKKTKIIYTINYIKNMVDCIFNDDDEQLLKDCNVDILSEELIKILNHFFAKCKHTQTIHNTPTQNITLQQIGKFQDECLLGVSIGLEILGRLLSCICVYDKNECVFDEQKLDQLIQLDWARSSYIWQNNIIRFSSKSAKKYTINGTFSNVQSAVSAAKLHLGWSLESPN